MQNLDSGSTGKVSWESFRKTLEQWVYSTGTHSFLWDKFEHDLALAPHVSCFLG